jgi:putative transcriptional regulator
MARTIGAFFCFMLFAGALPAGAQDLGKPMLLVASPGLQGPYARTALLAVPSGRGGHLGFILNRESRTTLARLFPQHEPSAKVVEPVFFGGPEATQALFAIVQRNPGDPSLKLLDDLYVTGSAKNIDRIIEQTPNEARYFAGFVGWRPEELAAEIRQGYWHVADPEAKEVLRKDTGEMWQELVKRYGNGDAAPPGLPVPLGPGMQRSSLTQ